MSRPSSCSTVSTLTHGAASSSASGRPSSRRQISATGGPLAGVRRNSGCTSRARSRKSRTAGERARSAVDIASTSGCNASGPTPYSRSPRTRSGARLVIRTRSAATDARRSATSGAASRTCSKLSSSSSVGVPSQAARARLGKSSAVASSTPSASATAGATDAAFRIAPRPTNSTRPPHSAVTRASSSARRVFPAPPGPVSVMRRVVESASQSRSVCRSASRPRRAVRGKGSERSRC